VTGIERYWFEERRGQAVALAVEAERREASQRLLDPELELQPRQAGPQAEMAATGKATCGLGSRERELVSPADLGTAELGVARALRRM
jgi:hypothetical protein